MNKAFILLLTFVMFCGLANAALRWVLWFTDPYYSNPTWTYPTPPAGYSRVKANSTAEEAIFSFDRALQYVWTNGVKEYYCGPKTYLNSNFLCVKHPLFWQTVTPQYCAPLEDRSNLNGCAQSYNGQIIPCCYISSGTFCKENSLYCFTEHIDEDVKYH